VRERSATPREARRESGRSALHADGRANQRSGGLFAEQGASARASQPRQWRG